MMITTRSTPFSICSEQRELEQVFKKYNVAITSQKTISESFDDPVFVTAILNAMSGRGQEALVNREFKLHSVIDYLERSHRFYLQVWIPEITHLLEHLVRQSGFAHPMLRMLPAYWRSHRLELQNHFRMEDTGLFPYAKKLALRMKNNACIRCFTEDLLNYSLEDFIHHHVDENRELNEIRALLEKYIRDDQHEFPYSILFRKLRLFSEDLALHTFIEDEILCKALKNYEKQLRLFEN